MDLSGLFRQEPGAIYRITLSFRQEYSLYGGKKAPSMLPVQSGKPTPEEEAVWDVQNTYWWDNYMDWEQYEWRDRDNPETPSYYMDDDRFPSINLLSSNLGLLAQYADGNTLWAAATDLGDAKPASGVDLEVYDFQLQRIGKGHTDGKGLAQIDLPRKPFILLGRKGKTTGYLRLADGYEKSMSRFDVGGQTVSKGLKGFIYGERGVWRPGDTLHVTMILADKAERLPEGRDADMAAALRRHPRQEFLRDAGRGEIVDFHQQPEHVHGGILHGGALADAGVQIDGGEAAEGLPG